MNPCDLIKLHADVQIKLTMEAVALDMLAWDAFSSTWGPRIRKGAEPAAAPVAFKHAAEYVDLFKGLLMQELHAHLVQVCVTSHSSISRAFCVLLHGAEHFEAIRWMC